MSNTTNQRLYWVWAAMIQRCHNPNNRGYANYGGRGVRVCDRWRHSFQLFALDMGAPEDGASIDRINNDGNYEPGNCRWATRAVQNNNRPNWCRYYTIDGARLTMKEAWRLHAAAHVTYRAFVKRVVSRGWDIARALVAPADTRGGKRGVA